MERNPYSGKQIVSWKDSEKWKKVYGLESVSNVG